MKMRDDIHSSNGNGNDRDDRRDRPNDKVQGYTILTVEDTTRESDPDSELRSSVIVDK